MSDKVPVPALTLESGKCLSTCLYQQMSLKNLLSMSPGDSCAHILHTHQG